MAYVAWMNWLTGKAYGLPSEAQREYAARGGTTTAYYWGDVFSNGSGYLPLRGNGVGPVGMLKENGFGLHDMAGHAWQWMAYSWHDDYRSAPTDGSIWTPNGNDVRRVMRGGSWDDGQRNVRVGVRLGENRGTRLNVIGFRLSRTLSPPAS